MLGYSPPPLGPEAGTPGPEADTPGQCMLGDTGNKRAVRILLEYNLVEKIVTKLHVLRIKILTDSMSTFCAIARGVSKYSKYIRTLGVFTRNEIEPATKIGTDTILY